MNDTIQILAQRAAVEMRANWATLVELAMRTSKCEAESIAGALSVHTKVGADSIRRKLEAIRYANGKGLTADQIVAQGQEATLGAMVKHRNTEKAKDLVWMRFQVSAAQRELVLEQKERVILLLGLADTQSFFDWLHSLLSEFTDEQIRFMAEEKDHP
jgi:hypothetical protein